MSIAVLFSRSQSVRKEVTAMEKQETSTKPVREEDFTLTIVEESRESVLKRMQLF